MNILSYPKGFERLWPFSTFVTMPSGNVISWRSTPEWPSCAKTRTCQHITLKLEQSTSSSRTLHTQTSSNALWPSAGVRDKTEMQFMVSIHGCHLKMLYSPSNYFLHIRNFETTVTLSVNVRFYLVACVALSGIKSYENVDIINYIHEYSSF